MNKTLINKIRSYQNQSSKQDTKKLFFDETGTMYITDSFSIIKFFDTTYNRKNRQNLIESIEQDNSCCNFMTKQVIKLYNDFEKDTFNIQAIRSIPQNNYCKFINNKLDIQDYNVDFNYKMLNKIEKIISTDGSVNYFISEKNEKAVCIAGKNGIAFLLGAKTY